MQRLEQSDVLKIHGVNCSSSVSRILLEDGTSIEACGFGAETTSIGELVFTTAMTGYPESLTDPSYMGQILIITHPLVGNYGVPRPRVENGLSLNMESESIKIAGLIVAEYSWAYHHSHAVMSLGEWLDQDGVPGAYGVDTRWLVTKIRDAGVMKAVIATGPARDVPGWNELEDKLRRTPSYDEIYYASLVSPRRPLEYRAWGEEKARVAVLDCGVKHGIVRYLLEAGYTVVRMPCDTPADVLVDYFDAVVLGSGPGNPGLLHRQARIAEDLATSGKPVLGICLGHQLLAMGLGARVYKMKFGHRAVNKPVVDVETGRCYITTHNHGYAVARDSLEGADLREWFMSPDDGTVEGFKMKGAPVAGVQFHPEAGPGPWDTTWIFKMLLERG